MPVKYKCKTCDSGCEITVPSENYEPFDCPSNSAWSDWQLIKEEQIQINVKKYPDDCIYKDKCPTVKQGISNELVCAKEIGRCVKDILDKENNSKT